MRTSPRKRKPRTDAEKQEDTARAKAWTLANPERAKATQRAIYLKNRDKRIAYATAAYNKDIDKSRENARAYAAANKVSACARAAAWKKANPARVNATNSKRRATEIQAAPAWLTTAQYAEMQKTYDAAKVLGHHVDHIVPLVSPIVCGLHVPWNLQILAPATNMSKKNKLLPLAMKEAA